MKNARQKMARRIAITTHRPKSPGAMSMASASPSKTPNAETNACSIRYLVIVDLLKSGGEVYTLRL
jgi:hypothetical protein